MGEGEKDRNIFALTGKQTETSWFIGRCLNHCTTPARLSVLFLRIWNSFTNILVTPLIGVSCLSYFVSRVSCTPPGTPCGESALQSLTKAGVLKVWAPDQQHSLPQGAGRACQSSPPGLLNHDLWGQGEAEKLLQPVLQTCPHSLGKHRIRGAVTGLWHRSAGVSTAWKRGR